MKHRVLRSCGLLLAAAGLALTLAGCGDLSLYAALKGDSPGELRFSPTSALVPERTDFSFSVLGGFSPYEVGIGASLAPREGTTWIFSGRDITGQSQQFTIQATDLLGDIATAEVTVYAVPSPLRLSASEVTLPAGQSWTFTATGGSGGYTWTVDQVPVDPAPIPDHTYTFVSSAPGSYTVAVTDSIGVSRAAAVTVRAYDPAAPLEISPLAATVVAKATLILTALGGTGSYSFSALRGTFAAADANPATYTAPASSGPDTVTLSDGIKTVTAAVTVIEAGNPPLVLSPQSPTVSAVGDKLQFSASGGTGPGTYAFSTNKPAMGSIDAATGSYVQLKEGHVVVTVRDGAGAADNTLVKFVK